MTAAFFADGLPLRYACVQAWCAKLFIVVDRDEVTGRHDAARRTGSVLLVSYVGVGRREVHI